MPANPGQTIRIIGADLSLMTDIIFPIIDVNGNISNHLRPDLASTDGTLAEVRVPEDAVTGAMQSSRTARSRADRAYAQIGRTVFRHDHPAIGRRLYGSSSLSVVFGATTVVDTGSAIDVFTSFLTNDSLSVNQPVGAGIWSR